MDPRITRPTFYALRLRRLSLPFRGGSTGTGTTSINNTLLFRSSKLSFSRAGPLASTSEYSSEGLITKTVPQLKEICSSLSLGTQGRKADLVERISRALEAHALESKEVGRVDYTTLPVQELKVLLKQRNLPAPRKKQDMIQTLESFDRGKSHGEVDTNQGSKYDSLKVVELKQLARSRGLPVPSKKADVISVLEAHDNGEEDLLHFQSKQRNGRRQKDGIQSITNTTAGRVVLSAKKRDTSKFNRSQLTQHQQAQQEWNAAMQANENVVVSSAAPGVSTPEDRHIQPQSEDHQLLGDRHLKEGAGRLPKILTHYLVSLVDNIQTKIAAGQLMNYIKTSMQDTTDDDTSTEIEDRQSKAKNVDVRVMQRTRIVRNEVTGKISTEHIQYQHGDILVSCYMTRDIAEYIYSLPGTFRMPKAPKDGLSWTPESGDLPVPLTIEQYTDAQQFFIADVSNDADLLEDHDDLTPTLVTDEDFEQERLRRMLLQIARKDLLEAKIQISMGKPAKYTAPYQIYGAEHLLKKEAMKRRLRASDSELEQRFTGTWRANTQDSSTTSHFATVGSSMTDAPSTRMDQQHRQYPLSGEEDNTGWYTGGEIADTMAGMLPSSGMNEDDSIQWYSGTDDWQAKGFDRDTGSSSMPVTGKDGKRLDPQTQQWDVKEGAFIRVVDGPFKTLRGKILEIRPGGSLHVRLDILGRDTDVDILVTSCMPEE